MDDIVLAALKKWPSVPACYGWLGLDARGDWYLRDERVQAAGAFPAAKGSRIEHRKLREFIERNYEADAAGAWHFQNGPQRVYVDLEAAPWVWRVTGADGRFAVHTHTGLAAAVERAILDDAGRLFLLTGLGFGIVHTQDVLPASEAIDSGSWPLNEAPFASLPARFGYRLEPRP